jgi:hypothetical protein
MNESAFFAVVFVALMAMLTATSMSEDCAANQPAAVTVQVERPKLTNHDITQLIITACDPGKLPTPEAVAACVESFMPLYGQVQE